MEVALVTGGNSGIGYEVVRSLAQKNMVVYLASRDIDNGKTAAAELADAGDIRPIRIDMTEPEGFQPALDLIDREQGRLDVLVNNAGIALRGETTEEIQIVFQTNLHGPITLIERSLPLLRRSPAGRIVNVSSGAGTFAFLASDQLKLDPEHLPYAYCVSKTALNAVTVMFAAQLRNEGIKVNACNPGRVATRIGVMQGMTPAEGARPVISLATAGADGPTGGLFDQNGPVGW